MLEAETLEGRRSSLERSTLEAETLDARRSNVRCSTLERSMLDARTLDARRSNARCSTLDGSMLDTRHYHVTYERIWTFFTIIFFMLFHPELFKFFFRVFHGSKT